MLNLMRGEETVEVLFEGSQFTLPNGDVVSPAYAGWSRGSYSLVEQPMPEPEPALPPTKEQQESSRQIAYNQEADPLFFKWQAGEATEEEWLAKRQEIRDRYPYPSE
jgi:hypothetical protein